MLYLAFLTLVILDVYRTKRIDSQMNEVKKLISESDGFSLGLGFSSILDLETSILIKGNVRELIMKEGQKVIATVNPTTRRGNTANIDLSTARWSSSDESVATVTQLADNPLKAEIVGVDGSENETVVVEFRADADTGGGVRELIVSGSVTVTTGDAFAAALTFDEPTDVTEPENGGGGEPQ